MVAQLQEKKNMKDVNFLLISDPKIWAMPVKDCHEPLVDIKEFDFKISPNRASFYPGFTKVRQSVANKLVEAAKNLPRGISFLFSEGHRPISLQKIMFAEYYALLASTNPLWDEPKLRRETSKFVAPAEDVPPHSTGGAIDITLVDASGKEIDMGSILDETPNKNENRNFTFAENIPDVAKKNRKILHDALSGVGFVNYGAEWWHWSYGDKYWAYHAGRPAAIYGSVE